MTSGNCFTPKVFAIFSSKWCLTFNYKPAVRTFQGFYDMLSVVLQLIAFSENHFLASLLSSVLILGQTLACTESVKATALTLDISSSSMVSVSVLGSTVQSHQTIPFSRSKFTVAIPPYECATMTISLAGHLLTSFSHRVRQCSSGVALPLIATQAFGSSGSDIKLVLGLAICVEVLGCCYTSLDDGTRTTMPNPLLLARCKYGKMEPSANVLLIHSFRAHCPGRTGPEP